MVCDLYGRMGFRLVSESPEQRDFELPVTSFEPFTIRIRLAGTDAAAASAQLLADQ